MGKVTTEKTKNGLMIINRLSPAEAVNEHAGGILTGNAPAGLLPVIFETVKKNRILSCAVPAMMTLRSYFSGIVTRKMFTDTVSQLIAVIKTCENLRLDARHLHLSSDYIYVDPRTKGIQCILWPLSSDPPGGDGAHGAADFFRELPYGLVFNKNEDCAYVSEYIEFFRALPPVFTAADLERLYQESAADEPPAGAPEAPFDPLKQMVEQNSGAVRRNVCPDCGIVNAMGAKICVSCGAALIERGGGREDTHTGTAVLGSYPGTTGPESEESPYPYLIRESTNQIISVDKPEFRIGKDKNSADFCVSDNAAISRSHAVIHIRDDRYFIVDQNSTNKTYIDGRAIPPAREIEIFPGAKIKLANEEFVFYI